MVVKEKKTTVPVKPSTPKGVSLSVSQKKVVTPKKKTVAIKTHVAKKSAIIPLKQTREPKNGFIVITNNVQKKVSVTKASQVVSTTVFQKPAIRSPFRFPLPLQYTVSGVARIFGIAFIGIGALLSFINLPIGNSLHDSIRDYAEMAATGDALISTTTSPDTTSTGTSSFDTTPDPRITIQGTVLSGQIPISINVGLANGVKVILQSKTTNQLITLGYAVRVDDMTWTYLWNTQNVTNGEYRIKVLISNQYTSYDFTDSLTYSIMNTPTTAEVTSNSSPTTTSSTTSTTSTDMTSETNTTISFSAVSKDTTGSIIAFSVFAQSASRVSVQARNSASNVLYYVGQATVTDTDTWRLEWSSKNIPDGIYYFYADVVRNGVTIKSASRKLTIANNTALSTAQSTTASTTEVTATQDAKVATIDTAMLKPSITLSFSEDTPFSGFVDLHIETSPVLWVELYAVPKNSLTAQFLGLASKNADTDWVFSWNTVQVPNGEYTIYSRVKSAYGFTEGARSSVRVLNQIATAYTTEQEQQFDSLQSASDEDITTTVEVDDTGEATPTSDVYVEPVDSFVQKLSFDETKNGEVSDLLLAFRKELDSLLTEYARAKRADDVEGLRAIEDKLDALKNDLLKRLPDTIGKKEIIDQISTYLSEVTYRLRESTLRNETILRERVGDAITRDSDKDGISDYDEVHLYKTNPFSADTDGDGHIDSSEISLGYDPHDSTQEALVTYQSPQDSGIVRNDILVVDEIVTLTPDKAGELPKAVLSGKGLPNSFVTLYIYSTPIIVTVKTDENGNWSYIFDKELESGNHEIYVGIIDNTGQLIAKSDAFAFAKTAEAFTKIDPRSAVAEAEAIKPSLLDSKTMLIVGSMVVVFLGLVLLLIGVYTQRFKRGAEISTITQ